MIASVLRFIIWAVAVGLLIKMGWDEPLRYRFMTRAEIQAEENPQPSGPTQIDRPRRWEPRNSTLSAPGQRGL